MEHFQTESRSNYENNKRHHTVDMGKENLDSSKSDEEYASCGFYVREKNEKCADSPETDIHNEDNFQNDTHDHNELQENEDTEIKSSKENVKYIKESELNDTNVKPLFSSSNNGEGENELNSMESNNTPKTIETTQLDRINKIVTPHSVDKSPTVLESLETDKCLNSQESDESNVLECLNSEKFDYGKPKFNDLDKDSNSYLNVPNELKLSGSDNNTTKSFKGTQISHPTEAENKEHESENKPDSDDIKKVECQSGITKQEENETEKKSILKTIASEEISEDKDPTVTTENEKNENDDNGNPDSREPKDDEDMDYDFDPSLLCPDISMDVDEAPVITNSDNVPNDGNVSPLPYEQSFSTYVDEMTGAEISFDLTLEEEALRGRLFGHANPIQFSKIHCTACNVHLGSALDGQKNRFVHPLLKVLICKNCYHFYTSGEFEKDEDGSELYCRWCGQGGQVLCCSSCEFVFCKRCIKNNFGMKKFKEIRDSDDWNCFRCDPGQLSILRASCAEFIDYVRGETAKVTLVDDVPLFMATDHTTCCNQPAKKKEVDKDKITQTQKRKRKNSSDDPDFKLEEESDPKKAIVQQPATIPIVSATPGVVLVPRSIVAAPNSVGIVQVKQRPTMSTFRVGQASFRPKGQTVGYTITRPQQQVSTPGFIKIMSPHIVTRSPTSASGSTFSTIRARPQANTQQPQIKHEWFEKTVRAAARVNSNLSYTLTQLNRQQSTASSVEALALIHNKLQEVLSTSINSLIQIRKNLRTEFIAGIKNIKFPPKSVLVKQTQPITVKDDDDVIFVNPTAASSEASPLISLSSAVTLSSVKKAPITSESPYTNPTPSTSYTTVADTSVRKGGYLKVKSFSALQNVSSECITIPDDPPLPPPPNLTPINKLKRLLSQNDDENTDVNSTQESKTNEINNHDDDVVEIIEDQIETIVNDSDEDNSDQNNKGIEDSLNVIDINKIISSDLKLKHGTFIYLERSREIDEILNSQIINGDQ